MNTATPDWSSLPDHLLVLIAQYLNSPDDTRRLRAVCNSFRSSVSPPPKPGSLLTNLTKSFSIGPPPGHCGRYQLVEYTVYAIEPLTKMSNTHQNQTWLVKVHQSDSGKVKVQDPFSTLPLENLSNKLPKSLNLLDHRVTEIAKDYRLKTSALCKRTADPNSIRHAIFTKVVPSTSTCLEDFVVMAIYARSNLGVWRHVDKKWNLINVDNYGYDSFEDIVCHNNTFYILMRGYILTFDAKSLTLTRVAGRPQNWIYNQLPHLVKSFKDLYLIGKKWTFQVEGDNSWVHFNVYKLDEETGEWIQVIDELEDRVLFVGIHSSFSVSAKEFPGCKRTCIYFSNGCPRGKHVYPGMNASIFDLKDGTAAPLSDFPCYSKIFWPDWLKQHSRAECRF